MTANSAALAARAFPAIVSIIESALPLPPARFSTMRIASVIQTVLSPGLTGVAVGTGPNGETFTAAFGERAPAVGELWRVATGEGGLAFLDDLVRGA